MNPSRQFLRWSGPALLLLALACDIPLHAMRSTPPQGIDQQALPVGARAPPVGRAGHLPAAVVFYRGHW